MNAIAAQPLPLPASLTLAAILVLLLPLVSFLLHAFPMRLPVALARFYSGWAAVVLLAGSHLAAWWVAWVTHKHALHAAYPVASAFDFTWLVFNNGWRIGLGFLLDGLALMMVLVVTGISTVVHAYSVHYMHDDEARTRFFSLLSFFTFAMLGLVIASNAAQTFIFWELVGAASYLLIGFWYHKPAAIAASKKAFILNRFADAFFLAGILLVAKSAQGFEFSQINDPQTAQALQTTVNLWGMEFHAVTAVSLLLFVGAWAKSALFPLHVWLPDAMEGPTPVSSLIHSATMVVAGIYLVARLFPFLSAAPETLMLIEVLGLFTALFAAIIACTQTDIKRILAYSTLSQLGYMMLAMGLAGTDAIGRYAYSAGQFHVFTHAFFKCLLFLSAGLVIHALHSQELGDAGGLRRRLPVTYVLTLIACLALAGIPPFAGFFSKDAILLAAMGQGHYLTFSLALFTGGLTAFYIFRYFITVFHGPANDPSSHVQEASEPPTSSKSSKSSKTSKSPDLHKENRWPLLPMSLLALFSIGAGFLQTPFFEKVHLPLPSDLAVAHSLESLGWLPWVATVTAIIGIAVAMWRYGVQRIPTGPEPDSPAWYTTLRSGLYIDKAWDFAAKNILLGWVGGIIRFFEASVVNGIYPAAGWVLRVGSLAWALIQNGRLSWYIGFGVSAFGLAFWINGWFKP